MAQDRLTPENELKAEKDRSDRQIIPVRILPHAADLPLPAYQSDGAAGMDLMAAIEAPILLAPGTVQLIPTGLEMAIPQGFEGQVRPRSGLAIKHQITVINAPGTIDSDYRGEVKVGLINLGQTQFEITPAMRIAQLVIAAVIQMPLQPVAALDETTRGAGGFGSTGIATSTKG
ncbi:MAG: dUTP diphosphatase [Candidatus Puniceispirillaceae bacterium]